MITRLVLATTVWLGVMAAVLFLAAGDWRWPQAWLFLAEIALASFGLGFWLARHDPGLLASRLSSPVRRDQPAWDRVFILAAGIVFLGWMALCACDARRFGWSHAPPWAQALGALLIALCMVVAWQTFRHNSFAVPQVRVQTERGQRVVSEGPYRIVRHPLYAGALLYFLGMPLLLGSWFGVLFMPLPVIAVSIRSVAEERMLRRELAGYDDYTRRVRFRLVPGVW